MDDDAHFYKCFYACLYACGGGVCVCVCVCVCGGGERSRRTAEVVRVSARWIVQSDMCCDVEVRRRPWCDAWVGACEKSSVTKRDLGLREITRPRRQSHESARRPNGGRVSRRAEARRLIPRCLLHRPRTTWRWPASLKIKLQRKRSGESRARKLLAPMNKSAFQQSRNRIPCRLKETQHLHNSVLCDGSLEWWPY